MEMLPSLSKGKTMQTPLQFTTKDVEVVSEEDKIFEWILKFLKPLIEAITREEWESRSLHLTRVTLVKRS